MAAWSVVVGLCRACLGGDLTCVIRERGKGRSNLEESACDAPRGHGADIGAPQIIYLLSGGCMDRELALLSADKTLVDFFVYGSEAKQSEW